MGTTVTVSGSALISATDVKFNGTSSTPTSPTAKSVKAVVPAGASTGPIQVVTSDGAGTSSASFKVLPKVTGFAPASGIRGSSVTISGSSFTGATKVAFGGAASLAFTVDDDGQITAVVPPTATTNKLTVTTPSGSGSSAASFIVILPPTVSSFTPASGTVGTLVTVAGSNLDSVTSASLNGQDVGTLTHVNATQLKLTIPAGASTGKIAATNSAGSGQSSSDYKVLPKVTGFAPASGIRGSSVTISGSSFTGATKVAFGGAASLAFTVDDDGQITAVVPPTATTNKLTVTTPSGSGSSAASFIVILPPTVSSFTPASGTVGTLVTVAGSNLDSVTSASLNGQDVGTLTHVNATQLKLTIPAGASTGKIAATNSAGSGQSSSDYKVLPKVTGFAPASGIRGSSVTISGSSFTGATKVAFGGAASLAFTVDDDGQITAVVPPTATTNKLTVTTPSGSGSSAASFIVILPPTVSSFTPASGTVGTLVTVAGSNLDSVTSASLNGQDVGTLTHVNATQLKLTIPAGASTGKIAATNSAGSGQSSSDYKVTPKITGYSPSDGAAAGAAVTITGTSLAGATLKFNGVTAPVESGSDDSTINTHVPATATTGAVSATTPGGATNGPTFKVLPAIASLAPDNGPVGTSVTVTGTTFVGVSSVKFNGVAATFSTTNATTIKATVPVNATTGPLTVTTPGGTAASPASFSVGAKVTSISPTSGPTGVRVAITGSGFHGTPTVTFNGLTSPSVTDVTPTSLEAVVPDGATTGLVQVATSDGTGTSGTSYTVTLSITGFSPSNGPPGTAVTLTGVGFLKASGVKFGNADAIGNIGSDTQITVAVPSHATTGPIVLGNASITVRSAGSFTVGVVVSRATSDRSDDIGGSQVHAIYVLPSDGTDRFLDTNGTIAASVGNFQSWLAGQTGGRTLRVDTFRGLPDITFFRSSRTDAQLASYGVNIRDQLESELSTAGFTKSGTIYAVYYDGTSTGTCGGGAWPPSLTGTVGALYLRASYAPGLTCYDPGLSLSSLQIMDFAMLHELFHTLGVVPTCSPHQTRSGHVSDSPNDLMYAGDSPWTPSVLDVARDDYYDAGIVGCADLSSSPFLTASP